MNTAYRESEQLSSDELSNDDDDDDDNEEVCWKRRKSSNSVNSSQSCTFSATKTNRKFRNNIWKNVTNEYKLDDALSVSHIIQKRDTTRGVESYLVQSDPDDENCDKKNTSNKFAVKMSLLKDQLGPMQWDQSASRSHINITFESPPELVAETIINLLNESNEDLIRRVVDILGVRRALEFYYLTEDIELAGGLYLFDGSRRRSPGGVYLNLIKNSNYIGKDERKAIFLMDKRLKDKLKRRCRQDRCKRSWNTPAETDPNCAESDSSDCKSIISSSKFIEPLIHDNMDSSLNKHLVEESKEECLSITDEIMEEGELLLSEDE